MHPSEDLKPTTTGRRSIAATEAFRMLGIGDSLGWQLVKSGKLRSVRLGRRVLIPVGAIDELLGERAAA